MADMSQLVGGDLRVRNNRLDGHCGGVAQYVTPRPHNCLNIGYRADNLLCVLVRLDFILELLELLAASDVLPNKKKLGETSSSSGWTISGFKD